MMRVLVPKISEASPSRKPRVGIATRYFFDTLDPDLASVIEQAIDHIRANAASVTEIDVPVEEDRTAQAYESYRYHAEFVRSTPDLYDAQTLARILRGQEITPQQYDVALIRTMQLRSEAGKLFDEVDVIISPTVPIVPPVIKELEHSPEALRPRELLMLRNTRPFNVLGLPTVSVPCGVTAHGLPVGVQLTTAAGSDMTTLKYATILLASLAVPARVFVPHDDTPNEPGKTLKH
jgi:Asp-tRNA(Asn)/Glu-tRNA(Gln) amidotransferase A subunit family amidase